MILTPHILVGAVIGAKAQSLGLIVILGLFSHFVLDKIPHWDYNTLKHLKKFKKTKKLKTLVPVFYKLGIDSFIGLIIVFLVIWQKNLLNSEFLSFILFGIFVSTLPDILLGFSHIFSSKKLAKKYIEFHKKLHCLKKIKKPSLLGLSTQIIVIIISVFLLSL